MNWINALTIGIFVMLSIQTMIARRRYEKAFKKIESIYEQLKKN